jgi:phosphoserine phosphatase RsbU/P
MKSEDSKHMQCMEVWGGNRVTDSGVIMPGLDAWIYSQPCEHEAAGGDVHYVSTCAGGWMVRMLVADVSGHGQAVAQTASQLRVLMRRYINDHDQVRFVRSLNREFTAASVNGIFATAVVMTFDAPSNSLLISNAGNPAPLWWRSGEREWKFLKPQNQEQPGNVPWGIEAAVDYEQFQVRLRVGDLILSYTDSLTEARDGAGELIGEEGLLELVRGLGPPEPANFVARLLSGIADLADENLTRDDVTCLLIRPNGLRPHVPLRDRLLAPLRIVADWRGVHFGWSGSRKGHALAGSQEPVGAATPTQPGH